MSAGPADQPAVMSSSRMNTALPSIAERAVGRRRGVDAERAARRERRGGAGDRLRGGVQTIATSTGSLPRAVAPQRSARSSRSGRGSRTDTASTPLACAAATCSSPLAPAPTTSTASPAREAQRRWRAGAGERLGERREHRVEAVERQQLADELGLDADVLAKLPGSRRVERKRSHSVSWPRRQRRHSLHGAWW